MHSQTTRCKTPWYAHLALAPGTCHYGDADLHHTIQITFGWIDSPLDRFVNYGKDYGIAHLD